MKRLSHTLTLILTFVIFLSFSNLFADEPQELKNCDWSKFSECLIKAIKSENEGVKLSAMQLMIRHSDKVEVAEARYEVMDLFFNSEKQNVRRLALVTLNSINHPLDMGLLQRQLKFEDDPVIKKHLAAVLFESDLLPREYYIEDARLAGH